PCRTRFGAGRYIVHRLGIGLSSGGRGFLGGMPASMTEIAFLHHPAHARSYAGIQSFLHARGPGWIPPVEVAGMIRTGCHTVAATEAALRHLADHARGRIDVHRLLRADMHAGS